MATMSNLIAAVRLTACLVFAAAIPGGVFPGSAHAEEHGRGDHGRDKGHHERHDDYRQQPNVYYRAPPVVVEPRGYFAQPGAWLSFSFPFVR
jgi:hypothetical protein